MFNTPARPTPRRGLRARDSVSRSSLFGAGSIASETPATRSRLGSVRDSSPVSVAESVATTTKTVQTSTTATAAPRTGSRSATHDEWDTRTWSRDERHSVSSLGPLPFEVNELLGGADFIVNSVSGHVDPTSGFALVSSPSRCVAWNYAKRTHGSPTVYNFEAPYPSRRTGAHTSLAAVPPALSAFVGGGSEPGLILVSATGEIRFWESVTHGLVEPQFQRYNGHQLAIPDGDFAEHLWKIDDTTFVLTTTSSAAWGISISAIGGRLVPTAAPFTRNSGLFSRSSTTIFNNSAERGGIVAVAPAPRGVYLLGRNTLQKWVIGPDGGARLVQEYDLRESIGSGLFDDARTWQSGNVHLELNDLVAIGPDQLAAFVSYTVHDGSSDSRRAHNQHKIVCFENNAQNNMVTIANIVHLSYVAHADPRMLDVPRLYIPPGSQTAFVRFADAIVMTSLVASQPYEDTITLKDSATNAFIGVAAAPQQPGGKSASLVAMAALGGIMNVDVHQGVVQAKQLSSLAAATARIKSKIEQAVFFGDRSENPLTFDLPAGFKGDLAEAAEAVSTEIVSSSSPYMPHISEIRPQLQDRLQRLKELMRYIHHNGGLSLLPQYTRRSLCSHAEKVKSAIELWDYQNRVMDQLHSRSPKSLLADSIQTLMQTLGSTGDEDVVRSFFRKQVLHIDRLLETVYTTFQAAVNATGPGADLTAWVLEANRIFLLAIRAASQLRLHETETYQVDKLHPMAELWTASDGIIGDLDSLYGATQRLIKDRTRTYGSAVDEPPPAHPSAAAVASGAVAAQKDQALLKHQMAHLAAALCDNMEDKLRTSATRQMNTGTDPSDGLTLAQRWEEMKPRIIRPLVDIDHVTEAYELAQHHRDFPTLVYLCHNPVSSQGPARIEAYIETFGDEFAFVLYQWYIDHGMLHELLTQDEVYGKLLTAFFEKYPHPELSWMHDIACKRYGGAAAALVAVDGNTNELADKHLINSIAKLSAVAEMKTYGPTPSRSEQLNNIDDELDMIDAEETLATAIRAVAPTTGFPRTASAEGFVAENSKLASRPAFKAELVAQVTALLNGTALDIESLVDILTLKNPEDSDAATALQRLAVARLPEGRKQVALIAIWRRVYIADDWRDIAKTSGRSEQAQRKLVEGSWAFKTLKALKETDVPPNYILAPSSATAAPLPAELAARYPSYPPEMIEALMADHENEISVLESLLDDESLGFEERIKGVMRLVDAGDEEEEVEGDVSM